MKDLSTSDCLKASADELKKLKEKAGGGGDLHGDGGDPHDPNNKNKITEWQAAWNVTNAIQVQLNSARGLNLNWRPQKANASVGGVQVAVLRAY